MTDLPGVTLHQGHVTDILVNMEPESVHAVVTSPPYWGLRKYSGEQDQAWGGKSDCEHQWVNEQPLSARVRNGERGGLHDGRMVNGLKGTTLLNPTAGATCPLCGAWRGALGLEPTPDLFIQHLMTVMAALWRVLRRDGVCWVNLDDTRQSGGHTSNDGGPKQATNRGSWEVQRTGCLKPKDMALIPEWFVLAAQAAGWYVRSKVVWALPNPMPESCTDRPSDSYQMIYMLTRSEHYWYDQEAVREANSLVSLKREEYEHRRNGKAAGKSASYGLPANVVRLNPNGHNLRNVWTFPTQGQGTYRVNGKSMAHFAAFPPELPRRAILASCPPYVCAECGAPWVREVATHQEQLQATNNPGKLDTVTGWNRTKWPRTRAVTETITWSPTCGHMQPEKEFCPPGIVLDCFCGSGTTLIAARLLGRRAVGIDLSQDYVDLSRHRLERVMAPLYPVTEEVRE